MERRARRSRIREERVVRTKERDPRGEKAQPVLRALEPDQVTYVSESIQNWKPTDGQRNPGAINRRLASRGRIRQVELRGNPPKMQRDAVDGDHGPYEGYDGMDVGLGGGAFAQ